MDPWLSRTIADRNSMADGQATLSVVVPCFNEEGNLPRLLKRLSDICRSTVGESYEILLVNDGSRDRTWPLIREAAHEDPHVIGISLSRNHGHQLALTAGLSLCQGARVLIIDADLQDPPELLAEMMEVMDTEKADVVYGQRRQRPGETRFKTLSAALFYRVFRSLVDIEIPIDTGDFRLLTRRALDVLNAMPEHHRFVRGMVSWIGFRQVPIHYDRDPRRAGATGYSLAKMVRLAVDGITGFSVRPLRLASYFGAAFGLLAMITLVYVMASWASGDVVAGWTSLMVVVLILGSIQLFVIGLMGEYLGRLYVEAKRRPLYVIADVVQKAQAADGSPQGAPEAPILDQGPT